MFFFTETDETLGGPSTCPYDSIRMPSMLKNNEGFNNLPRPKHQDDYPSFGGVSEKLKNYESFVQQPIITKGKNTLGSRAFHKKINARTFLTIFPKGV